MRFLSQSLLFLLAGLAVGTWFAPHGSAQSLPFSAEMNSPEVAQTENVTARLIVGKASVQPGETILIGLHKTIREGWHTYWKNPGDSGLPTTIRWQVPENVTIGDILWPAPQRKPYGPLVNYGYAGTVILLSELTVPADAVPGTVLSINADAEWLVCEEICIPEAGTVSLELPVTERLAPATEWAAEIAAVNAALPKRHAAPQARFAATDAALTLEIDRSQGDFSDRLDAAIDVWFFPAAYGVIDHAAPQIVNALPGGPLQIEVARGTGMALGAETLDGVLVIETEQGRQGYTVTATAVDGSALAGPPLAMPGGSGGGESFGLAQAVLFAMLGGILLNLMPCVFPVLSMKALSLCAHGGRDGAGDGSAMRASGLAYTAGVLATFALVAVILIGLQASGQAAGWGFQLQSPVFVTVLIYVLFALGLNLAGLYEIGARMMGVGETLTRKDGLSGSFFTGALAVIVATPCTAPFMGSAVFYALTQPWPFTLAVFLALGLGLALPFLLLALVPGLAAKLPRPGPWMDRFKQLLAFPMFGAAVWLVWVLAQQTGANGVGAALVGCVLIAFAIWAWQAARGASGGWRVSAGGAAVVALVGAAAAVQANQVLPALAATGVDRAEASDGLWQRFSRAKLESLRAEGRAVFVNMTAAWCITCKVNERVALSGDAFETLLGEHEITALKGDWTNRDPEISALLADFDRAGVPLYVLYPPAGSAVQGPILLPQLLTPDLVAAEFARLRET